MSKIHAFDEDDAIKYGYVAALLLHHIRWWLAKNEQNEKHIYDGKVWTYNSNKAFAGMFPFLTEKQIRGALDKLIKAGVLLKGDFNQHSYDRTSWYTLCEINENDLPPRANAFAPQGKPIPVVKTLKALKESTKTPPGKPEGDLDGGFGLAAPADTNTTEFDRAMATKLEAAVRTLPPRTTGILQSKPSAWANHICALRVKYDYTEDEIARAMAWYAANIGKEFTPKAYSGEAFRRKFSAILQRAEKTMPVDIEIGPNAMKVLEFLDIRAFPAACQAQVPAAVQVSVAAYKKWWAAYCALAARLIAARDAGAATPQEKQLANLAEYAKGFLPRPVDGVLAWFRDIQKRVTGWADFRGDLTPYLWHTGVEEFQRTGRALAQRHSGHPERWDMLCTLIEGVR